MGWCRGTDIAQPIIDAIVQYVDDPNARKHLYHILYYQLTMQDWDCVDEVETKDACWYAVLCENDHHIPIDYDSEVYICRGGAHIIEDW